MRRKVICALAAVACALSASVQPAGARAGQRHVIVFAVQNLGDGSAACPGALFGLSFDLAAPSGAVLGHGVSCVESQTGCQFAAGCRDRVRTTFVLDLSGGSITARMVLREAWPTDSLVLQRGKGRITSGTGDFTGARGSIVGGGAVQFGDTG